MPVRLVSARTPLSGIHGHAGHHLLLLGDTHYSMAIGLFKLVSSCARGFLSVLPRATIQAGNGSCVDIFGILSTQVCP